MRNTLITTITLFMVLAALPLTAQEDTTLPDNGKKNTTSVFALDKLIKKGKDEKHFFWELGGWYSIKSGNTDNHNRNGMFAFKYDNNITIFTVNYQTFYDRTNNETTVNNGKGGMKFDYHITQRIELFLFSITEYDRITSLDLRNNSGAGAKFVFFRNQALVFDISAAPIYQYEEYNNNPETDYRASFRGKIKILPHESITFSTIVFYVPKFSDFDNYRTDVISQLEIKLKNFSAKDSGIFLKGGYQQNYNSTVPEGTDNMDRYFFTQLILKL